ncbi:MAG: KpsF/GutQ family sugar-phosphate isomerase [Chitinophagales bacterium]
MNKLLNEKINRIAIRTLEIEAQAIETLKGFVEENFYQSVQTILATEGRVVFTGVGKSAIVAQKIVATFNSTGTPALFMHAADAIHGDLGMIRKGDVVICLSKSGETAEIKVLIPLLKNVGSILIALVGNMQSYLAQQVDFAINTTVQQEACPHNLAPTASTAAQMAMGDALAVCILELRGFSTEDFARFHPGGALGKQLYLRVSDVYAQNTPPKVLHTADIKSVIIEISSKMLGATAVVNEQDVLMGVITDGDLRRTLQKYTSLGELTAQDIMTLHPKTIEKEAMAVEAMERMKQHKITQLVVVEAGQYVGIVHIHDLIREGLV